MKRFRFLMGDVNWQDYGGKWYRQLDDTTYHVIELINMWDATGEEEQDKYVVELREIDLLKLPESQIKSAIGSCSWINDDNLDFRLMLEAIHGYGYGAPMGDYSGNNYSKLLVRAKRESYNLEGLNQGDIDSIVNDESLKDFSLYKG